MILAISGTPGVGKTYIAKKLSKTSNSRLRYFDLNKYVKDNKLFDTYDKRIKTYDVDVKKLKAAIELMFKTEHSKDISMGKIVGKTFDAEKLLTYMSKHKLYGVIIDSHLSHYIDCDYCIIVKSNIKRLSKRLEARKYSKKKIRDNIESEIFEVCLDETRSLNRKIIIVEN